MVQFKGEAAFSVEYTTKEFYQKITAIITEDEYVPDEVFNVDETALF